MAKKETRTYKFDTLDGAVEKVLKQYDTQADAARDMDVAKSYLCRMLSGVKGNPSEDVLSKMGITRHVHYTVEA